MSGTVADQLLDVLGDRTCLVGMGNPWRNDDGVGVWVAERLRRHAGVPPQIEVMSVEDVIESYAFDIASRPVKNVVLVDAAVVGGASAGSIVFGTVDELEAASSNVSTHKLALRTVESVFRQSGKNTYLLGIVPGNLEFGNEISAPVAAAADRIVDMVVGRVVG